MTTRTTARVGTGSSRWVVVAPYRQPRSVGGVSPWGTVHVRRDGALLSACGQLASSWHTFWNHAFEPGDDTSCPTCSAVLRVEAELHR